MAGDETYSGWISLHRRIRDHWIWQDPVKLKWWLDILLSVNHEDKKVNIGMRLIECKRGQTVMSLRNWADRWKVSRDSTRNFLELLKKDGMITTENLTNTTRITVCNYGDYQGGLRTDQTLSKRKANAKQTPADTNNNDYNDNKGGKAIPSNPKRNEENLEVFFTDKNKSLIPVVKEWLEYKIERKEHYKPKGLKSFITILTRYSKGDPIIAMQIIERSMANNWKGIFELNNNGNGKTAITTSRARQKLD